MSQRRRATWAQAGAAAALCWTMGVPDASASSHREAPLIAEDPAADATDLYAFRTPSSATDGSIVPNSVVILANYWPLEEPGGGPNWPRFSDGVLYEIKIDNDGDAVEDISYQFRFRTEYLNSNSFLLANNQVTSRSAAALQVRQRYTVTRVDKNGTATVLLRDELTPPVYAGTFTMGTAAAYEAMAQTAVYPLGGDASSHGRVFAGQRDDPFFADLGGVFDLVRIRCQNTPNSAVGCGGGGAVRGVDYVAGYNVHTLALQIPIPRLYRTNATAAGKDQVIGIWTTASRPRVTIRRAPPLTAATRVKTQDASGAWVQVSRLGLPLINELIVPLGLKDYFNSMPPSQDELVFNSPQGSTMLTDPELARALNTLYGLAVPAAGRDDLTDLVQFSIDPGKTGTPLGPFKGKSYSFVKADILRLDMSVQAPADLVTNRLGALGAGDNNWGFPNGRRPHDDVVDIAERVVGGVLRGVTGAAGLGDGVDTNDRPFPTAFPYVPTPWSGSEVNSGGEYRYLHTPAP